MFNPNIPQPSDLISVSQGQLLINNQQLNTVYGTAGDHFAWNNGDPTEQNRHAKVTLPGLPTTNPPGDVLPTPGADEGAIFSPTVMVGPDFFTYPIWRRDAFVTNYPIVPIKAYAEVTFTGAAGAQTLSDSFNITSITRAANTLTITMTNPLQSTSYGIIHNFFSQGPAVAFDTTITSTTVFTILSSISGSPLLAGRIATIIVIQA